MEAVKYLERWNIESNNLARRMIEEAIATCPENPVGYTNLSLAYLTDHALGNTKSPRETLEKAEELAKKALAMDDSIPHAHITLTNLYNTTREYDKAIAEGERAVALDPTDRVPILHTPRPCSLHAGRRKPFQCSKKQSDSTPMPGP